MAAITALLISFIIGPLLLKAKKYQIGELIREDVQTHLAKRYQQWAELLSYFR